ncbi:hypothetical protein AHEVV2_013 [Adoxophyes honmai entomopoxvirus 'L' virophage 2]|nr:hypothetical protein AHEVV2_013 [Adoxophyes honmai entomopoxvirus 'L' virophage 2]
MNSQTLKFINNNKHYNIKINNIIIKHIQWFKEKADIVEIKCNLLKELINNQDKILWPISNKSGHVNLDIPINDINNDIIEIYYDNDVKEKIILYITILY